MKILLINQAFVSPEEPGHTRHYELAQYLKSMGHELVIVASDLNYQTGLKTVDHKGISIKQNINGIQVMRAYIYPALHKSYFWRIISFFSFMFSSIWVALKVKDVDLVMGTTPPIFQAVSAWVVAMLRRKPFLLEVRDLWPEFIVSMGVFKNPVLIKMARWLEKFLYSRATHILVNSPAYAEYIQQKKVPEQKISYIPYGTDIEMFSPENSGQLVREKYNLSEKFVVLYAGALGQANDIYTIIRAANLLKNHSNIQFVLFGDGKEKTKLVEEVHRLDLHNILFAGVTPKKEMPSVLAAADVCLAILQDISMFRTTYPNKVFDYMAAGKATILVIDGVVRNVIEKADGGVFVHPGDEAKLAEVVLNLSCNLERVKEMGRNARLYLVNNLDRRDKLTETLNLLEKLVN
ncbi:MAG: glycosyltransferase family 4 protein [Anaerolineaceae bacterium]